MKILITGSTGLLGQALSRHLAQSCEVTGLSRHDPQLPLLGRHQRCDLLDVEQTTRVIDTIQPDIVIHTQALSDVDRCEQEPMLAHHMNVQTTQHLVRALQGTNAQLIYISTDYVFDGTKGAAYDETDIPHPISIYGQSKLAAEQVTLEYPRAVVVRPSTLFGPGRMNFCDFIVEQLRAGASVEAFEDQVTSPTYTVDLAEGLEALSLALVRTASNAHPRAFHLANYGGCSRLTFAHRVAELLQRPQRLVRAIPMTAQRRPAARPAYSMLTTHHVPQMIGRTLRPWDEALQAYLHQRHPFDSAEEEAQR